MTRLHRLLLALLLPLLFVGCRSADVAAPPSEKRAPDPPVLLISIDGLRWDYLDLHEAPTLSRLAQHGTHVQRFIPAFPTKTFPNHYTLVTGLYPSNHGIIANNMYDPEMDASFSLGNREAIANGAWWGGEPLWVTAEQQGLTAATYFWPGSEAPIKGVRPTYWYEYDGSVPGTERVNTVLEWLDLPAEERPSFITLYFSRVDSRGHEYGPETPETKQALRDVDGFIEQLMSGLQARGLENEVNLLITSDHGMSPTSEERAIILDDYIDLDDVRIIDHNPVVMMEPREGVDAEAIIDALSAAPHLSVYHRDDVPARLHFRDHRRIPTIIGLADDTWSITTRSFIERNPDRLNGGTHGYDPAHANMHTLLIGHGPAFKQGARIDRLASIHLYELMAALLDLEPAPNDGDLEAALPLLRSESTAATGR